MVLPGYHLAGNSTILNTDNINSVNFVLFCFYVLFFVFFFSMPLLTLYSGAPAAEGRQAEPHTHIRKLKGTHELIFSCVSWLAVLLVGAYARRRRRRRRWWSRATWRPQLTRKPKRHVNPWFKASFGHPCCSQLTPVKTRNPLTSIT